MLVMSPAGAEDISRQRPEIPDPGAALDELQRLLDELGRLIERMPRYALPEVTEDGDIIIRRKDAPDADEPPDDGRPAEEGPDGVIDL